jgi:REP element-mobilizing transposase RayT
MATRRRILLAGGVYHVYNRGVLKEAIFHDHGDREHMLWLLEECSVRYGIEVRSYCLMTNHVHLHVRTPGANLSEAMHWLFTAFSCRFNVKCERTGHVFETRFKSPLIQPGRTELKLSRYIHRNPIEAGMVRHPAEYPWSSMRQFLRPAACPAWLHAAAVLDLIPAREADASRRYLEYVSADGPEDASADRIFARGTAIGSLGFLHRLAGEHGLRLANPVPPQEVVDAVARIAGLPQTAAIPLRHRHERENCASAFLLRFLSALTNAEIGAAMGGRCRVSVQHDLCRAKELLATDPEFSEFIRACLAASDAEDRLWTA